MRFFLLGCALLVSVALVGCGKSPHDAIWAKAVGGMEEIESSVVEVSNGSAPAMSVTKLRSGSQKLIEAANELKSVNISQDEKKRAEMPYSRRIKASAEKLKSLASSLQSFDMVDRISVVEAAITWDEATGFSSPSEIAMHRAEITMAKSAMSLAGGPTGGIPSQPGAGMGLPPGGPGGAPSAPAGGAMGLPPGGPGGAIPGASAGVPG